MATKVEAEEDCGARIVTRTLELAFKEPRFVGATADAYVMYHVRLDGAAVPDDAMATALRAVLTQQWELVWSAHVGMCITRMRVARRGKTLTLHCNMRVESDADTADVLFGEVWNFARVFDGPPKARVGGAVATAFVVCDSLMLSPTQGALDAHTWATT